MVRAAIAFTLFRIAAPALPAAAQDIPDVEAGVSLFWVSHYEGTDTSFRERAILADEDWALYESLFDDGLSDEPGPGDYFVLFSGILYRSCDGDEMPGQETRDALSGLFPLSEGKSADAADVPGTPTIRVGAERDFFLMGQNRTAYDVVIDYAESDEELEDEKLIVLADNPYSVSIDWGESGMDRVMLIAQSNETPDVPAEDLLGSCASLLN